MHDLASFGSHKLMPDPDSKHIGWRCSDCTWVAASHVGWRQAEDAFHQYHLREYLTEAQPDPVNHPTHYTSHPSGVECITVTEWMGFNLGNAVKYIWRADEKGDALQDLEKAKWYLEREIERRKKANP